MRRGEVWWGAASLAGGSRKRRPFLVVSSDVFNRNAAYPKVMVVHLTSVRRTSGPFPWEVELPRGTAGLPMASTAKCAEVYTVLKEQLAELVGTIPQTAMSVVEQALALAFGMRMTP